MDNYGLSSVLQVTEHKGCSRSRLGSIQQEGEAEKVLERISNEAEDLIH